MTSCPDTSLRDGYSVFLESIDSLVCGTLAYGKLCVAVTVERINGCLVSGSFRDLCQHLFSVDVPHLVCYKVIIVVAQLIVAFLSRLRVRTKPRAVLLVLTIIMFGVASATFGMTVRSWKWKQSSTETPPIDRWGEVVTFLPLINVCSWVSSVILLILDIEY